MKQTSIYVKFSRDTKMIFTFFLFLAIFQSEGENADCLFIVLNGRLRSVKTTENGKKKEMVCEFGRSECVGLVDCYGSKECLNIFRCRIPFFVNKVISGSPVEAFFLENGSRAVNC